MQPKRAHGTSAPVRDLHSVSTANAFPSESACFATNASQFARTYGWHS